MALHRSAHLKTIEMKRITPIILSVFMSSFMALYAQESKLENEQGSAYENPGDQAFLAFKIKQLNQKKAAIIKAEKEALASFVLEVDQRQMKGLISLETASALKKEAAALRADNIAKRSAIIDLEIELLQKNDGDLLQAPTELKDLDKGAEFSMEINGKPFVFFKEKQVKYDRRTYSDFVISMGLNNLVNFDQDIEGVEDVDFQLGGSRFFEFGWVWRTRMFENSNFLRLNYGIMFQYHGLRPKNNQYVGVIDGQTQLAVFEQDLRKSKFRTDNLVFPMHLEFGRSDRMERDDKIRYSIQNSFRIGIGGYSGINLSSRQKLKYTQNGERVKEKLKQGYDVSQMVYGLSAYAGRGGTQLYAKYDLSPLFASGPISGNNISLGVRFDL